MPDPLRTALETAFGLAPAEGPADPIPLRMAVLTLLAGISHRQRVLLAVDDVQHFDRDSLDVLSFVMRRITAQGVPMLLAARGQTPPDGVPADLYTLLLEPLTERAAAEKSCPQIWTPRSLRDYMYVEFICWFERRTP
ncbi:MAG: hypothetical protein ACJ786_02875 [Catenulispora sp.]